MRRNREHIAYKEKITRYYAYNDDDNNSWLDLV